MILLDTVNADPRTRGLSSGLLWLPANSCLVKALPSTCAVIYPASAASCHATLTEIRSTLSGCRGRLLPELDSRGVRDNFTEVGKGNGGKGGEEGEGDLICQLRADAEMHSKLDLQRKVSGYVPHLSKISIRNSFSSSCPLEIPQHRLPSQQQPCVPPKDDVITSFLLLGLIRTVQFGVPSNMPAQKF
ncbi:hypothetical protein SKAU_G00156960 [Synaphobranchus kaupii]|uniref:Uncharacterized protein n=1 Tax=Synaphobranchus kaupii TaxID=118154 RepID=A0A9Q1FHV6_SYNKA|nr:hypothetical protein SKAU_G00156960 [Synaphobranchus kaupii]